MTKNEIRDFLDGKCLLKVGDDIFKFDTLADNGLLYIRDVVTEKSFTVIFYKDKLRRQDHTALYPATDGWTGNAFLTHLELRRIDICDLMLACVNAKHSANDGGKKWGKLHDILKAQLDIVDKQLDAMRSI